MIRPADTLHLALRAITAHRLRSFLTLLGIAVGIAAVILLTSIGEGIHRFVLAEFTQFGTNVIGIGPGKTKTAGPHPSGIPTSVRPLTLADADSLKQLPHVTAVTPTVWGNTEVGANGRLRRTTVYGVSAAMTQVFSIKVRTGQFLPPDDSDNARPFVVLGAKLKNELFGAENPLGAKLKIGTMQFRIVGVLETKGQFLGIDLDDTAYIPAARALELFNRDGLMEIHVSYTEGVPAAQVSAAIRQTLTARHGREDFTITTQEDMLRTLSKILDILTMAVGALGSISLLVGAVGIGTIMTIAITERTTEIGLLRALGARRVDILEAFLVEAAALGGLGGVAGVALAAGIVAGVRALAPALPLEIAWPYALAALVVSGAIGVLAGLLPAARAARLDPIEALRTE